jgi:hypothetical protein
VALAGCGGGDRQSSPFGLPHVPKVTGLDVQPAWDAIEHEGLCVDRIAFAPGPKYVVVSQAPRAAALATTGSGVAIAIGRALGREIFVSIAIGVNEPCRPPRLDLRSALRLP